MTPLMGWLRRLRERWIGTWEEGPDPPARLRAMVLDFANQHPRATRAEWTILAEGLAGEAWRQGWLRGYEHAERDPEWRPDVPPEVLADWLDPAWRESEPVQLTGPTAVVPEDAEPETDLLRRQMNEILESAARYRP